MLPQPAAKLDDVLPPRGESISNSFVALFGRSPEEVAKCQILKAHREAYVALVRERAQVNPFYHAVGLGPESVAKLPAFLGGAAGYAEGVASLPAFFGA